MKISHIIIVLMVIIIVVISLQVMADKVLDIPTVYKSVSTGKINMMTKDSYPCYIYDVQLEDLPVTYNLIHTK